MRVWRLTRARHAAFDGEGARRFGSRWTSRGHRVVFAATSLALAALELLAHTGPDLEPDDLVSIAIDVPGDVAVASIDRDDLPQGWRSYPAPSSLAAIGDLWILERRTAVLSVPSVIVPVEWNVAINPAHDDFARLTAHPPEPFSLDPRGWRA